MAIHRGIQSAIFYYVSCAPCSEARIRKQRKEEAKRDRAARLALEDELPNLYRHPSPSSTNPHWQTEIALGPTLAARGKRKTDGGAGRVSGNASGVPSSVNLPPSSSDGKNDSKLNLRQRDDEVLWGSSTHVNDFSSMDGLRRPPTARTIDSSKSHRTYRNPPINELHPATVTRVTSRDEVLWMLQPPPVAEIMSGKEPASSGRSMAGVSRKSPNATPSSVAISDRSIDNTLKVGSPPSLGLSRSNSSRASNGISGQRHDRSSATSERDFAFAPPRKRQPSKDQRHAAADASHVSAESSHTVLRRPSQAPEPLRRLSQSARPQLSTILSDSLYPVDSATSTRFHTPAETPTNENFDPMARISRRLSNNNGDDNEGNRTPKNSEPSTRPLLAPPPSFLVHENSLKFVQQDLSPGAGALLNTKIYATTSGGSSDGMSSRQVRLHSRDESSGDDVILSVQPEIFEKLQAPEFELPEWIHEHTKRDGVRERWSMDL